MSENLIEIKAKNCLIVCNWKIVAVKIVFMSFLFECNTLSRMYNSEKSDCLFSK